MVKLLIITYNKYTAFIVGKLLKLLNPLEHLKVM